jgi:ribosomal protein S27E
MEIFGCAGTEDIDKVGESVKLDGMDISEIHLFNDEHESDTMFQVLGKITEAKKIYSEKDIKDEFQKKAWDRMKRPFLYVRGKIADEEGHPNAAAAASLIRFAVKNPDFRIGLSVEGSTLERRGNDLVKTKVKNVALTVKPANPHTFILPVSDLMKSYESVALPEKYKEVEGRRQFRNIPDETQRLLAKSEFLEGLKELIKSPEEVRSGAVSMKCWNCGESKLFMKSRLPNRCTACSEAFTMNDIFKALKKDPII